MAFLLVLALATSRLAQASITAIDQASAPMLAWSNRALLDASSASVYESAQAGSSAAQLVLGAIGKREDSTSLLAAGQAQADLAVVFLGSQVDAATLRQAKALQPIKQLSGVLSAAQSSLVLPFVQHQGVSSLLQQLRHQLQSHEVTFQVVGCDVNELQTVEDLAHEVLRTVEADQGLQVLLVCASTARLQGSSLALQAEVDQLEAVQAAVYQASGSSKHMVFVYANQPVSSSPPRRRLQASSDTTGYSGFGPYVVCGPMCITQVAWLQGILALLFLGFAACSGLSCLYLINGPSRFETAKDITSSN